MRLRFPSRAAWTAEVRRAVTNEVIVPAAEIVVDTIRDGIINAPARTGRVHQDGAGRSHVTSAPGEPPAATPAYLASWKPRGPIQDGERAISQAYTAMKTARGESLGLALEYGDDEAAPRPHVRNQVEEMGRRIQQHIDNLGRG